MKVLRARLYEAKLAEQQAELAAARSAQVGTGDRAEKIRTYNFPERRVTDHRIKLTRAQPRRDAGRRARRVTGALQDAEKRERLGTRRRRRLRSAWSSWTTFGYGSLVWDGRRRLHRGRAARRPPRVGRGDGQHRRSARLQALPAAATTARRPARLRRVPRPGAAGPAARSTGSAWRSHRRGSRVLDDRERHYVREDVTDRLMPRPPGRDVDLRRAPGEPRAPAPRRVELARGREPRVPRARAGRVRGARPTGWSGSGRRRSWMGCR